MNQELPIVLIKRKNIQTIFDYCLDNKVQFTVREKPFTVEEFEVILQIEEVKKAIAFGIYARENKLEIVGVTDQQPSAAKANTKRTVTPAAPATAAKTNETETLKTEIADKETSEENDEKKAEIKPFSLDLSSPSLNLS